MFPKFAPKRVIAAFAFVFSVVIFSAVKFGFVSEANTAAPQPALVPTLNATKTATLLTDANGNAFVNPGDALRYLVTINNTGADPATGVSINDTIDANTTLVGGSVIASAVAVNDAYASIGNVGITVPDGAGDLLSNDLNPNGAGTLTIIAPVPTTTTQGGTLSINPTTGAFTYNPPAGFEGTDSFTYTLSNGTALTDTATVTINVSGMIWFVNNNAGACSSNCNGRLSNPFTTLAAFQALNTLNPGGGANPDNNDNIFIYESATAYTGGVTLRAGQKLIGQDATASLATIAGVTTTAFTNPLFPAMNTGGSASTIQNAAGSGVTLSTGGNTLRGFTASNASAAAIAGTNFGTVNIADVIVNTNGQALNLNNGTVAGAGFASVTSTGGANNVLLTSIAGTLALSTGALSGATANGFDVDGGAAAITYSGTISNSTGKQVEVTNKTGGAVTLSGAVSGTGTGVNLTTNTGATINFTGGLTLSTGANAAFTATGGGTINVCDESPCNAAATGALVNSITTTTGTALNVANTTIGANNLEFRSISANGAANGIVLQNTGASGGLNVKGNGGTCTLATPTCTGGTIQNTTSDGIVLENTRNFSLSLSRILNAGRQGIWAKNMTGATATTNVFTLMNSINVGAGDGDEENAILFENDATTSAVLHTGTPMTGKFILQDVQIDTPTQWGVRFHHLSGTMNLTVTRLLVQNNINTFGEQGFTFRQEAGTANVLIDDSDFLNVDSNIDGGVQGSGTLNMTIQNSVVNQSQALPFGINFVTGGTGTGRLKAMNNTLTGCSGGVGQVPTNMCSIGIDLDASVNSTLEATIHNNTITQTGIGGGLEFIVNDNAIGKADIRDNNISLFSTGRIGMNFQARTVLPENNETGQLHLTIEGNTINNVTGQFLPGFAFATGASGASPTHANLMCVNLDTPAAGANIVNGTSGTDIYAYTFRQRTGTTFQIQGLSGGGTKSNVQTFINNQHGGGTLAQSVGGDSGANSWTDVFGAGGTTIENYTAATCQTPATVTLPSFALPADEFGSVRTESPDDDLSFLNTSHYQALAEVLATIEPFKHSAETDWSASVPLALSADARTDAPADFNPNDKEKPFALPQRSLQTGTLALQSAAAFFGEAFNKLDAAISPTVTAQEADKNTKTIKAGTTAEIKAATIDEAAAPQSGETVTKALGTLPPGENIRVQFDVTVDANIPTNDFSVSNTAQITATNHGNINSTTATTTVVQPPTISKAFGATNIAVGGTTTLTFTVGNANPATNFTNISFSDNLPAGMVVAAAPNVVNNCGGTVTANAGASSISVSALSRNANLASCTIVVNVTASTDGAKNNVTGTISSTQGGTGLTASATLNVIAAPTFTKAFGAPTIALNGTTTLSFTVTNASANFALSGVSFTDSLPSGLVVAPPPNITGVCGGGTITANAGASSIGLTGATLAANSNCTFSVNVTGTTAGVKNNSVQLSTAELGAGATATASVTVVAPPTIAKAFSPTTILQNNNFSVLTITITNPAANSTVALAGVGVVDNFPAGIAVDATPTPTNTCGGTFAPVAGATSITLSGGSIPIGGNCSISVRVRGTSAGALVNTTDAVTSTNGGTGLTASATLTVTNTATWVGAAGAAGTDWHTATNWNPAVVPAATNDVSIPATGVLNEPTISSSDVTVSNLTIAAGRTLNVNAGRALTVTNALTDNGTLNVAGAFSAGTFASTGGTVNFTGSAAQSIPALTYNNLSVNNAAGATLSGNATINGALTLTNGIVNTGTNTLTLAATATSSRGGSCTAASCFVASDASAGGVSKLFNAGATANFTFHVGTTGGADNGYTPVALANITANAAGDGLTARAVDAVSPASISSAKITRYWELTEIGSLTTDLTFIYLDADDASIFDATALRVFRNSFSACLSDCVNEAAFTGTATGVADFSPWTIAQQAPTAATVEISGRVVTAEGRGISRARVSMVSASGEVHYALTNPFGYYRFTNVPSGETYVFNASHKRHQFASPTQALFISEERGDVNFVGLPNGENNVRESEEKEVLKQP